MREKEFSGLKEKFIFIIISQWLKKSEAFLHSDLKKNLNVD